MINFEELKRLGGFQRILENEAFSSEDIGKKKLLVLTYGGNTPKAVSDGFDNGFVITNVGVDSKTFKECLYENSSAVLILDKKIDYNDGKNTKKLQTIVAFGYDNAMLLINSGIEGTLLYTKPSLRFGGLGLANKLNANRN